MAKIYDELPDSATVREKLNLLTERLKHVNYCVIQTKQVANRQKDFIVDSDEICNLYAIDNNFYALEERIVLFEKLQKILDQTNYIAYFQTKY